ncbi:unnamed protein product, partial [Timema podura]|nr:unnamed protein product [Timema podura]
MKITSSEAMSNIKEFFPTINNDLTKVTWALNVHNDEGFHYALEVKWMMIESDVELQSEGFGHRYISLPKIKKYKFEKNGMTLKHFLQKVADAKSLGVKLNFDKINVFGKSIKVLQAMSGK